MSSSHSPRRSRAIFAVFPVFLALSTGSPPVFPIFPVVPVSSTLSTPPATHFLVSNSSPSFTQPFSHFPFCPRIVFSLPSLQAALPSLCFLPSCWHTAPPT